MFKNVQIGVGVAGGKFRLWHSFALFGVTTAIVAVAVGQTVAPRSSEKPQYLSLGDPAGIGRAMQAGDSSKLKALSEAGLPEPAKSYALASYYRSIFQISLSSKYAKICYQNGLKQLADRSVNFFPVYCGELLAGNYAIRGQIANWARTMQEARDSMYQTVVSITHHKDIIFPHFGLIGNRIDMKSFYDFPIETISGNTANNIVIPRVLATGKSPSKGAFDTVMCALNINCFGPRYYYVKVNVNGHNVVAVLDTGTVESVIAPLEAQLFGVHANPSPYYFLVSTKNTHAVTHLGYARSIRIGTTGGHDIALRNVPVMVGGKLPSDIPIVLGLDVLSKLARLSIRRDSVVVNPDTLDNHCTKHLHIRSTNNGSYTIFLKYPVDGRLQDVALDTGENQYLFGTSVATAARASAATVSITQERATGNVEASFYPARTTFGNGAHEKYLTIPVFPSYEQTYPYVIGSDILQDYDISLDFAHGEACLNPR